MKIIYHPHYERVYASDPAAKPGRMESITKHVMPDYELVTPEPASITDVKLVHTNFHMAQVQRESDTYEAALLAAGGAIHAAELAAAGEPAFGLIRPPGHHASADHCWGFCFFNNMAISIARLRQKRIIDTALILDIDLHFGDGTENIFLNVPEIIYLHPEVRARDGFVKNITELLSRHAVDIIGVSAGFDRHIDDWGGQLTTEDYFATGKTVKDFSEKVCRGRRFGVLEGGYNHEVLGKNVRAFVDGMK
ncbi:MAG: histone deacetylase family protein [Dehalococcoidia bacterium]|nr:histone deacetylase family protein [Dehalococcoidia bacterium]